MQPRSRVPAAPRLLAGALSAALLAGPALPDASANALSWKAAVSGNAGIASNWNPAAIPSAADALTWAVTGGYTVTFDSTVPASASHDYRQGTVSLAFTSPHTIGSGGLRVGDQSGDAATAAITSGSLTSNGDAIIGNLSGSTGTLNVNASGASLSLGGSGNLFVGAGGTGTVNITNAGAITASIGPDFIGNISTGNGTVLVSGALAANNRSRLSTGSQDLIVGVAGTGSLTVSSGALVTAGVLRVANGSGSHGTAAVNGGVSGIASTLQASSAEVAHNTTAGTAAGTGTMQITGGGLALISGATTVGDPDGGTGTLTINTGGKLRTGGLVVDNAHGVLGFNGGTITVTGGTFKPPGTTLDLDATTTDSVALDQGASASFDGGSIGGYALVIGDAHQAGVEVTGGSTLTLADGHLALGLGAGSRGALRLDSNGSVSTPGFGIGTVDIGVGGNGRLDLLTGGSLNVSDVQVGVLSGGRGVVNVDGSALASTLTAIALIIGGQGATPGGSGTVIVKNGGAITLTADATSLRLLGANDTLEVDAGGSVNAANGTDQRGHIIMGGGQLTTGQLSAAAGSTLSGFGTVNGAVANAGTITSGGSGLSFAGIVTGVGQGIGGTSTTFLSGGGFTGFGTINPATLTAAAGSLIIANGDLTLSGTTGTTPVALNGKLVVGPHLVTVHIPTSTCPLGSSTVLGGGALDVSGGTGQSFSVPANDTLQGVGSVNNALINSGVVLPGASSGILHVNANFTESGGKVRVAIGDPGTNQFSQLNVNGTAVLGGTLDVHRLPGLYPSAGQQFTIMTWASHSGTFSNVTFEGQPVNGQFSLTYNLSSLVLTVNGLTTDVGSPGPDAPRELAFRGLSGGGAAFELDLPDAARVDVRVFDVAGREVAFRQGLEPAGRHRYTMRGLGLASGVYFGNLRVVAAGGAAERRARAVLLK